MQAEDCVLAATNTAAHILKALHVVPLADPRCRTGRIHGGLLPSLLPAWLSAGMCAGLRTRAASRPDALPRRLSARSAVRSLEQGPFLVPAAAASRDHAAPAALSSRSRAARLRISRRGCSRGTLSHGVPVTVGSAMRTTVRVVMVRIADPTRKTHLFPPRASTDCSGTPTQSLRFHYSSLVKLGQVCREWQAR